MTDKNRKLKNLKSPRSGRPAALAAALLAVAALSAAAVAAKPPGSGSSAVAAVSTGSKEGKTSTAVSTRPAGGVVNSFEPGLVAKIGDKGVITEQDLADFSAAESCYGSDAINSRKAGFMRMLEATIGEEILRRDAGGGLTSADYEAELERVDRDTRAPEILDCIKKYFSFEPGTGKFREAGGRDRYKKVFLRKYMAPARVFRFTHYDPKVQKEAYRLKDAVLKETAGGAAFTALADSYKLSYSTHQYTAEEKKSGGDKGGSQSETAALPGRTPWSPYEKQFIDEHLATLKPGDIEKEPIESADDIQFVKLLSVTAGEYYFESLRIKKKDDYYQTAGKLRSVIKDEELRNWILGISGNPMLNILQFD